MGTQSEANEQAIESLRRRNADLEVLYETVKDLSSTLSVELVLQRLLDRTLQHLEAEIGSILLHRFLAKQNKDQQLLLHQNHSMTHRPRGHRPMD